MLKVENLERKRYNRRLNRRPVVMIQDIVANSALDLVQDLRWVSRSPGPLQWRVLLPKFR